MIPRPLNDDEFTHPTGIIRSVIAEPDSESDCKDEENTEGLRLEVIDALETIDSALFTGDNFTSANARAELRGYMSRFERGLQKYE